MLTIELTQPLRMRLSLSFNNERNAYYIVEATRDLAAFLDTIGPATTGDYRYYDCSKLANHKHGKIATTRQLVYLIRRAWRHAKRDVVITPQESEALNLPRALTTIDEEWSTWEGAQGA
jgi:hypothetical protein